MAVLLVAIVAVLTRLEDWRSYTPWRAGWRRLRRRGHARTRGEARRTGPLAHHSRPQGHRDTVRDVRDHLVRGRRDHGLPHPGPARGPLRGYRRERVLQFHHDEPRDHDAVPLRDAHHRGVRELLHPAAHRRRRHGVPADQRHRVLAVAPAALLIWAGFSSRRSTRPRRPGRCTPCSLSNRRCSVSI